MQVKRIQHKNDNKCWNGDFGRYLRLCSLRSARAQAGGVNAPPLSYGQMTCAKSQKLPVNLIYSKSAYG